MKIIKIKIIKIEIIKIKIIKMKIIKPQTDFGCKLKNKIIKLTWKIFIGRIIFTLNRLIKNINHPPA